MLVGVLVEFVSVFVWVNLVLWGKGEGKLIYRPTSFSLWIPTIISIRRVFAK